MDHSLENLIPVINKLQDVFTVLRKPPIDLPQIAVVGSQSVGKSSVIENIVGRDFLPRGSGIVTRRPLILQLEQMRSDEQKEEYGEFLHKEGQRFYDFAEIRREIEAATDTVAGGGKNIVPEPIRLKICSPNVVNLTLIDLPGIVKNPLPNQPKNIEEIVMRMILDFIEQPRCLILAVSAATFDLANSEGLKLARQVDPDGNRTLGVITKLDLMDKGTNAVEALRGRVIPLKLGYIGVVNRAQQKINEGQSIRDALEDERRYFTESAEYRHLPCGTEHLVRTLNRILVNHIKREIPQLREEIRSAIKEAEDELLSYGDIITDDANKQAIVMNLISKYAGNFSEAIEGSGVAVAKQMQDGEGTELYGGARIVYIFQTDFRGALESIGAFDGLSDDMILSAIRNASGIKPSVFVPELAFENIVRLQIEKLRRPCLNCVETVYDELKRIAGYCNSVEVSRFNRFSEAIEDCVTDMFREYLAPCREFLNSLIDVELAYINTNHPDFLAMDALFLEQKQQEHDQSRPVARPQAARPVVQPPTQNESPRRNDNRGGFPFGNFFGAREDRRADPIPNRIAAAAQNIRGAAPATTVPRRQVAPSVSLQGASDREVKEVQIIKKFILSYFKIVKKNVGDAVPKTIMHLLVNKSTENLAQNLTLKLYRDESVGALLEEDPQVAEKRRMCFQLTEVLRKALLIINELRDVNV